MKSKIKPFSVEITKKDGFMTINDAIGYFPTIVKDPEKEWLFVVERVDGSRYLCNRDDIVDIFIYGEENDKITP